MKINKTMRRRGVHEMPLSMPKAKMPTLISNKPMRPAIKTPKMPKIGYGSFPKGHVY